MHAKMNDEHRAAFKRLLPLTPTNLHLRTSATFGQHIDFENLWFKHSPTAARYYLFTSLWKGNLSVYDDHDGQLYGCSDSANAVPSNENPERPA